MMEDFELVPPPSEEKPVNAKSSTKKLYDEWMKMSEIHGHGHEFTQEAYKSYLRSKEEGQ